MPNCFNLTRKSDMAAGPVGLAKIDEEICNLLGWPVHPTQYANGWFDYIGFNLACDWTFERILGDIDNLINTKDEDSKLYWQDMRKIAVFLQENFEPNNWVEIGKR